MNSTFRFGVLLLICLVAWPANLLAQGEDRMEVSASLGAKEAVPGETITAKVKFDIKPGFHSYPTVQKDPKAESFVTKFRIKNADKAPVEVAGKIKEPAPKEVLEPELGITVGHHEDTVEFEVPIKVKTGTPPGPVKFSLTLNTQVCDDKGCVPFVQTYDFDLLVKTGQAPKSDPATPASAKPTPPSPSTADEKKPDSPGANSADAPAPEKRQETLYSFLMGAIFFGFITLLTPCVFPMIPITVSFFLKQESQGSKTLVNALVYTLTIVVSMAVIAFFFVQAFQKLTQIGSTNLILGALFIYFALSLFGMYEITLPSFLTRWTSAGEAKGGYVGTIFMALTFTIISFSCVAPFLGGFAGATASERPLLWNVAGALGFATAFASPFFFLALFPSWLKRLPKSGSWLNTMKVVMGFLEVAAALKFFRAAELLWTADDPKYLTYDMVLGMYITICLLCGLYLIGVFRLPHDDHGGQEKHSIGVGRLIWSFLFLGLGFYLLPGLFRSPDGEKLRPAGTIFSWVDSFLLPGSDTKPLKLSFGGNGGKIHPEEKWFGFLNEALVAAKSKKQRIFIDFTGVS